MIVAFIFLCFYGSMGAEPTWSTYRPNVMYSGEYHAFLVPKNTGLLATFTQPIYRSDVLPADYFTAVPRVILSLMGYKQNPPANGNTSTGFDVKISTITNTNFQVIQNIYGSGMGYLVYMYLAISQTNTDFFVGQYTQVFDQNATSKSYSFDIANNVNETYQNYPTNTIEMKGFLAGYKFSQGTSSSFELNFTLDTKNGSFFTIQVSINANSVLEMINYYRIGYDRTSIERKNYRDVFRDIYFELVDGVNVNSMYNVSWGSVTQFQYRNFFMGTNKININNGAVLGVEFYLYYYFAQNMSLVDVTTPYVKNPAIAKHLYGNVFYHAIANCTGAAPNIYFLPTDRKCYSACPTLGYFTDSSLNTCIACHFTCRTCSAGYLIDKCLSCDANYRVFNSSTSKCDCPVQTFDDLTNLTCPSCYTSCITCASSAFDQCKSCDSSANRILNDPNSDGIGQCLCKTRFSENSTNKQCQSCSVGCLTCSFSGSVEVCSSCNTNEHWTLVNGSCVCPSLGYFNDTNSKSCVSCHYSCQTCSAGLLADKCLSCNTNYRVFDSLTSKCNCPALTFDDLTNLLCPSCHSSCLTCVSSNSDGCKTCDQSANREMKNQNSSGVGQCLCKSAYSENSISNKCQSCSAGCLACSFSGNTEMCSNCDTSSNLKLSNGVCSCLPDYTLTQGKCILQKCGDGILTLSQQCDDGNVVNRDGCSSSCKVETQHACFQDPNISPYSVCYFNGTITMTITDVSKSLASNQVSLTIKVDADSNINEDFLKSYLTNEPSIILGDVTSRLLLKDSRNLATQNTIITNTNYDSLNKILQVSFTYNSTFDITKKKIKFQPSFSSANPSIKYFYNSPQAFIILENTYNKIDTTFYEPSQYERANKLKYAFLGLLIAFWIISLIMILIGKGNIGMEMMIVYQITYASLLSQEKLEISFAGLIEFGKYTAGYNVEFVKNHSKCMEIVGINLSCDLFNNLNISFFLMVLIALIYWGLKLLNKILNDKGERQFNEKKHKRYMQQNNERTDENIIPNLGYVSKPIQQSQMRSMQSESIRKIQDHYYKDQEFISKAVYNFLLDLEFYLCFVTVIIWAMTISFISQSSISGITQSACVPVGYCFIWTFWLLKYFKEDFSFTKAHKRTQNFYEDDESSQVNEQNQERNQQSEHGKKSKFSASFLRVLIYPIIWLFLLAIGVVLALSQPVGYVSEALIIAGSLGFLLLTVVTEMHQQKLHKLRTVANCIFLVLIQVAYILSQSDSISGSGLPIAAIIFVFLSLILLSNSVVTFYLFRLQMILLKKKKQSRQVEKIQMKIKQLESLKRQKELQNPGLFLKLNDFKSSQNSESQFQKTIRKDPKFQPTFDYDDSPRKNAAEKRIMTRQEIHQMFNSKKIADSQPYVPVFQKQIIQKTQKAVSTTPKKKLFSPKNFDDLSSMKFQSQLKNIQFFPSSKATTKK